MEGNNRIHVPIGLSPKSNEYIKYVTLENDLTHAMDPSNFMGSYTRSQACGIGEM